MKFKIGDRVNCHTNDVWNGRNGRILDIRRTGDYGVNLDGDTDTSTLPFSVDELSHEIPEFITKEELIETYEI